MKLVDARTASELYLQNQHLTDHIAIKQFDLIFLSHCLLSIFLSHCLLSDQTNFQNKNQEVDPKR